MCSIQTYLLKPSPGVSHDVIPGLNDVTFQNACHLRYRNILLKYLELNLISYLSKTEKPKPGALDSRAAWLYKTSNFGGFIAAIET